MAESLSLVDVCINHKPRGLPLQILRNISLRVAMGEIVGVVGARRTGRTAVMHVAAGLALPESGQVELAEVDITTLPGSKRTALLGQQILWGSRMPEESFTVRQHVGLSMLMRGLPRRERDRRVLEGLARVGALDCAGCSLASLSGWERLLAELARAVALRPQFILIDGLVDDVGVARMQEAEQWIRWLVNALGCGVLIGVANPESVLIADHVWCLDQGTLAPLSKKVLSRTNVSSLTLRGDISGGVSGERAPVAPALTLSTQASTRMDEMPAISRFFGITIAMYFDDHTPPHFHVRSGEFSAKIRTDTLELLVGDLPRRELRLVLAWAELHASELQENWRRAREGETLLAIEPL